MKKQNGITLLSLIIYVVVMTIVVSIMTAIILNFYKNTTTVQGRVDEITKFNKFNTYFLKEVKALDNSIDKYEDNPNTYILFSSGNSFSKKEDIIYYNNIPVCDKVTSFNILLLGDENEPIEEKDNIQIDLTIGNYEKSIKYKIENLY